jgi:hypothetical protein
MPQTNAYTRGIKYIKIAKLDSGSVDNSIELQSLTDIRIQFSDIPNVTQYNVGAINEYPTYYLYTIVPTDVTSSANQEILNYKVSGSSSTKTTTIQTNTNVSRISSYTTQSGTNTLGYLTASSGIYSLGNTPNTILNWTSSINMNYGAGLGTAVYFIFGQLDNNGYFIEPYTQYDFVLPGGSGTISKTFSSSFTPVENQTYGWGFWQQNSIRISYLSYALLKNANFLIIKN